GFTTKHANRVDALVASCFVLEFLCLIAASQWRGNWRWLLLFTAWRILDIAATAVRLSLFDRRHRSANASLAVASHERVVVLGLVNYVELVICFASIYAGFPDSIHGLRDGLDVIHLSVISQLTIGYGDIYPEG